MASQLWVDCLPSRSLYPAFTQRLVSLAVEVCVLVLRVLRPIYSVAVNRGNEQLLSLQPPTIGRLPFACSECFAGNPP